MPSFRDARVAGGLPRCPDGDGVDRDGESGRGQGGPRGRP
jgi:hypothetical protein